MRTNFWMTGLAAAAAMCVGCLTNAQVVITQWDFNASGLDPDHPATSIGVGTANIIGGATNTSMIAGGAFPSQSGSSDPNPGVSWSSTNYPPQSTADRTAGFEFIVSTVNYTDITFRYDGRDSSTASRYFISQYSTDGGMTWHDNPNGPDTMLNGSFVNNRTLDLTGVPAANNNPNFRVRVVAAFAAEEFTANSITYPANSAYRPAGTAATSAYAQGGTFRIDMVTISGNPLVPTPPTGVGAATPRAVCVGGATRLTVAVTGGLNPPSSSLAVSANLSAIGGPMLANFSDDGMTNGDQIAFDNVFTYDVTTSAGPGSYNMTANIVDGESRMGSANIHVGIGDCNGTSASNIVISQVYGGGGGGASDTINDYVELFNRSSTAQDITGWSVQYASASGGAGFLFAAPLSGTINPGQYYLVQMSTNGTVGNPLPTPDAIGPNILMAADTGRVLLSTQSMPLGTAYADPSIVDLVGYGNSAITFEGAGSTANGTASIALFRKLNGCQDTNQNFHDFEPNFPAPRNTSSPTAQCSPSCHGDCVADFDDGTGTGTPDGGVTIEDLLYYLAIFDLGDVCADVDDGSSTGTQDGGVTIEDLLYYLTRFDAGC